MEWDRIPEQVVDPCAAIEFTPHPQRSLRLPCGQRHTVMSRESSGQGGCQGAQSHPMLTTAAADDGFSLRAGTVWQPCCLRRPTNLTRQVHTQAWSLTTWSHTISATSGPSWPWQSHLTSPSLIINVGILTAPGSPGSGEDRTAQWVLGPDEALTNRSSLLPPLFDRWGH